VSGVLYAGPGGDFSKAVVHKKKNKICSTTSKHFEERIVLDICLTSDFLEQFSNM